MLPDDDGSATLHDTRCVTTYVREKMSIASTAWLMWRVIATMSPLY